ncbi:MAG: ABC transporter substrate-binding protein [Methylobacter sp.]|nr:ABC transporter substrate-binding protein [Methylobacter sp.]
MSGKKSPASPVIAIAMKGFFMACYLCVLLLSPEILADDTASRPLQRVTLQLKWKHQFQFAGYYAALEKGYYRKQGLDVRILEGGPERPPVRTVINGGADFGVSNTQLLLERSHGAQVVALAAIIQHSPLSMAVRRDSGIRTVKDLAGRKLMIGPDDAELQAYFKQSGLGNNGSFQRQQHSQNIVDLINRRTDGLSAYTPDQPYALEQAGVDYLELRALDGGIDFYGDVLFTTEQQIKDHPEQVKAFRQASLQGWAYAIQHPDEIAELIHQRYATDRPLDRLLWEARRYRPFIMADLIELGHMSSRRWQHIADTYAQLGMLPPDFDFSGMLYDSKPYDLQRLYPWLGGGALLLVILALFSAYVVRSCHKLRIAKLTLDKLVSNAPGMTYQFQLNADGSSCFPFASKGITDVFGIEAKTVKHDATAIFLLLHPDDIDSVWESIRNSAQQMTDCMQQFRVIHPQKGEIWLESHSTPERLNGDAVLWHGFVCDITDRKHAEQTLQNSENRFRQMFEPIPVAYQSLDIEGHYLDLNNKMAEMLGYSREQLLGRCFGDFWIETAKEQFPLVFNTFKTAQHVGSELQLRRKDGSTLTVLIDGRIQRDVNGEFMRTHCILWDISERKHIEDKLVESKTAAEDANKAKSDFLSHMSHELRTPLNAIIGFAQLLEIDELTPLSGVQKEAVGHIMTSGSHLLSLINEVLDLARIENGKLNLNIETVDLDVLKDEVLSRIRPMAAIRQIDIGHSYTGHGRVLVRADARRLRQIVLNLLSNAIKYNRQGGSIALSSDVIGNNVRITVLDTGMGISDQYQAEVFQPFQRLGIEKTAIEGAGIGLVICNRLIKAMGGSIGFHSFLGIGSQFWIELPIVAPACGTFTEPSAKARKGVSDQSGLVSAQVLYIEDSPINLNVMRDVFCRLPDIELLTAENAEIGLAIIHEARPDLVLMDINLPGMSGLEALHTLKANPDTCFIPVIAVSAAALPNDIEIGLKSGFLAYLTKPFDVPELIAEVHKALRETATSEVGLI